VKIRDLLGASTPSLSFEFFPPKTEAGTQRLFEAVRELQQFRPDFVSVTYGAGGSTRAATADIVERLQREHGLCAMAHLTCVGSSRAELVAIAQSLQARGIENVMALRGDPPQGEPNFRPATHGLSHASDLIRLLRAEADFCVAAACYPEKHPQSLSLDADVARLAEKVAAGADFLITQFIFDAREYFAFVARARRRGIGVPIIPGVLPLTDFDAVLSMATKCCATVPNSIREELANPRDDAAHRTERGLELTRALCEALLAGGAPGLHFYTRNRSDIAPVLGSLPSIGVRPSVQVLNVKSDSTTRYGLTPLIGPQYVGRTSGA
jgi:methylenetetrahydrofolate reductase (NADPH)